ncbi:MAG: hypothetical protein ACK4EX_04920 [Thermaurantimonas sp.]
MVGISKFFEKKTANKAIALIVFELLFSLAMLAVHKYLRNNPSPSMIDLIVFLFLNSLVIFVVDFAIEKIELSRKNIYYLPILFALNVYVFFKSNTIQFLLFELYFIIVMFFVIKSQNKENIRMDIFHFSLVLSILFFIFPSSIFLILPIIFLLLFFSVKQVFNIVTLLLSISLTFFFLYSNLYFIKRLWNVDLYSNLFTFFEKDLFHFEISQITIVLLSLFLIGLYEVPQALRKTNLFRKNFFYFSLILIIIDIIFAILFKKYTQSFSLILLSNLFGNFIRFRPKYYVREVFFTGVLILLIILLLI